MTSSHLPIGNLSRLNDLLQHSEFDAIVAVSPENVAYSTGVFIQSQRAIRDRLAILVLPKSGEPTLIVCNIEEPQARAESFVQDIRGYAEFKTSPIALLIDVLKEKGITSSRIGFEAQYLTALYYRELIAGLSNAAFGDCDTLFARARMIKTSAEIDLLTRAAQRTERALLATYSTIRVGETEKSMADRLANNMLLVGAQTNNFLFINAGPNTGYPHCLGTDYKCRIGDIVKTDCGGTFDGYLSDIARTGVVGKPSEEQTSIYNRLLEVHRECIDLVRPGNCACDIFQAMRDGHKRVNLHFPLPHAGHSVGLAGHETPILSPVDRTEIEENMMFCVETRVRWLGEVGYHIEDLVLVTDGAPRILTTFFDTGHLFEI